MITEGCYNEVGKREEKENMVGWKRGRMKRGWRKDEGRCGREKSERADGEKCRWVEKGRGVEEGGGEDG